MKKSIAFYLFPGFLFLAAFFFAAPNAFSQAVYYLYPAGGQRGTKFEMVIGINSPSGTEKVVVTGGGVDIKILERPRYGGFLHQDPFGGKCMGVYRAWMEEESRLLPLRGDPEKLAAARAKLRENREKRRQATPVKANEIPTPTDEEVMRSTTYWHRFANPTIQDLQLCYYEYSPQTIEVNKKRHSPGGSMVVEVSIAPDAEVGVRDLQVVSSAGISRAVKFWVSDVPEVNEIEPNEASYEDLPAWDEWKRKFKRAVELPVQDLPVVFNGQIKPGDVDKFYFHGKAGQRLVFDVQARSTCPYIANAVPGWFCAVVNLYDPEGKLVKYSECYRFDQNPMMFVRLPEDGQYMVEVLDSIYRGRNDFVYRLSIGEFPVVYSQYPLGGRVNEVTPINIMGGNLPVRTITPNYKGDVFYDEIREITSVGGVPLIRPMHYMVETLPIYVAPLRSSGSGGYSASAEGDSQDKAKSAGKAPVKVDFPIVIYDRIATRKDIGLYQFEGRAGQQVTLDVTAQPLGSALDPGLELLDPSGNIIASNDDRADSKGPNIGEEVSHSDPILTHTLPRDGLYTAKVYPVSLRGGPEYYYRLRISPPQPDFDICSLRSCLRFNGKSTSFTVRVYPKEGFKGEIQIRAVGSCAQMKLSRDGKIPAGQTEATFSLVSEEKLATNPMEIELVAEAQINGKTLRRKVLATDDWEQAFIYHHLVPMKKLMATQK